MLRRFPSYVSILAALIVIVAGFIEGRTPYEIAIRLVFVIAVVYLCSIVIRAYLRKAVFVSKEDVAAKEDEQKTEGNSSIFYEGSNFDSDDEEI